MEEISLNPFWKLYYKGADIPKVAGYLEEARKFAAEHDVTSIKFYVGVLLTAPGKTTEQDFNQKELTKEELNSLTKRWVDERIEEAAQMAKEFWNLGR